MFGQSFDQFKGLEKFAKLVEKERKIDAKTEERIIKAIPKRFSEDREYFEHVILESLNLLRSYKPTITIPTIDMHFEKKDALPLFMQGLLWENWKRSDTDGTTVFLENYSDRGANNLKKKAYFSGLTSELYDEFYEEKVATFFDSMLASCNQNKPLIEIYNNGYLDLYWNLHLQACPDDIPAEAKQVALDFINCWAIFVPLNPDDLEKSLSFKESYMSVRNNREALNSWIESRVQMIQANPEEYKDTFVYYWLQNDGDTGEGFETKDITFECFHNYLALSQWGNTIYGIMDLLREDNAEGNAPAVQAKFKEVMEADQTPDESGFTPLDYFVSELFRVIMPNGGSVSRFYGTAIPGMDNNAEFAEEVDELSIQLHAFAANSSLFWEDASATGAPFNPDRYQNVPKSDALDEEAFKQSAGLAKCPFDHSAITTKDGRTIENNMFGTTYSKTTDGKSCPVIETAGYSPFGFGYRRCPGELLTVNVFKTFLKHVWDNNITFYNLNLSNPESTPIAPGRFIDDNIGMKIQD